MEPVHTETEGPARQRRAGPLLRLLVILSLLLSGLYTSNALTRHRHFSPDSMNYVDVARNIRAGHGMSQSTLGFFQPLRLDPGPKSPLTAQSPGYPILISLAARTGLSEESAALLLSALGTLAALFGAVWLAHQVFGSASAWLTMVLLLLHAPLMHLGRHAWSDGPGLALALASFLALRPALRPGLLRWAVLAGLLAGLAFAFRFALAPVAAVGALALACSGLRATRLPRVVAFLLGCAAPVLAVVARNHAVRGTAASISLAPDPLRELNNILTQATGRWLWWFPSGVETALLCVLFLVLLVLLWRRRRLRDTARHLVAWPHAVLVLSAAGYLVTLAASRVQPTPRLVAPITVTLALVAAYLWTRALALQPGRARWIAAAVLVGVVAWETGTLFRLPPVSEADRIRASESLTWIADHTGPNTLILAEDAVFVPFYFRHPMAASYSPHPWEPVSYETLTNLVDRYDEQFDTAYLIVNHRSRSREALERSFGPFIAAAGSGDLVAYPRLKLEAKLAESVIYRVERR